ncbi:MAG: UDP-galactopyranose mutase [Olivibacter sp.]|nr:UDP-galactopyranose mutase [Olivibacter sp. UJ_SKK_5.1]
MKYDLVIVGAGFAGSVAAERLANTIDCKILLIDQRSHIGGNAFDYYDANGILVHKYGPHIFHTNSTEVFQYLSKFTKWRFYEHKVLANVEGKLLPIPINLNTVNSLYGFHLSEEELKEFFVKQKEFIPCIRSAEDVIISQVGRDLYLKFFHHYTIKQWGVPPSELDKSVTARIPVRTNVDDRYFTDKYQFMPVNGYSELFKKMLSHSNIDIRLNTAYKDIEKEITFKHLIYTGPIDEYFDFCYGKLPYRSLQFEHRMLDQACFQQAGVINFPAPNIDFTRITEYKHITGQQHPKTSITYEYPCWGKDPYYPVPSAANALLYSKYCKLAEEIPYVSFTGRLGSYRYYNMDQVVAQSLTVAKKLTAQFLV